MKPFKDWKVGDIVKCIDQAENHYLTINKNYKIFGIPISINNMINIPNDKNYKSLYYYSRFEWVSSGSTKDSKDWKKGDFIKYTGCSGKYYTFEKEYEIITIEKHISQNDFIKIRSDDNNIYKIGPSVFEWVSSGTVENPCAEIFLETLSNQENWDKCAVCSKSMNLINFGYVCSVHGIKQ